MRQFHMKSRKGSQTAATFALPRLEIARKDGRIGGRPPKLKNQQQAEIIQMVSKGTRTAAEAARLFRVHPATVLRLLAPAQIGETRRRTWI